MMVPEDTAPAAAEGVRPPLVVLEPAAVGKSPVAEAEVDAFRCRVDDLVSKTDVTRETPPQAARRRTPDAARGGRRTPEAASPAGLAAAAAALAGPDAEEVAAGGSSGWRPGHVLYTQLLVAEMLNHFLSPLDAM